MNHKNGLKLGFILLLLFVVGLKNAEACSCGPTPNVLDAFEESKNVVVLKAVSVEKVDPQKDGAGYFVDGVKSTKMVVEKVYKGKLKVGDELTFSQGGGANCIWTFNEQSIDKEYLFYLDEGSRETRWTGFGCGRSTGIENAADDLLYLDNLNDVRGKSRISGRIEFENYSESGTEPNVEGIKISVVGNGKTFKLKTDKNGVYEIYNLPAGVYYIIPDIPKGWKVNDFYLGYVPDYIGKQDDDDSGKKLTKFPVRLKDKRHAKLDLNLEIDNSLRGKIYDPGGKVMKGVCVRLYPPTGIDKAFMYKADCTEADGAFSIREVPPGSYILVANDTGEITSSEPFPALYYPGVFEREKAAVVNIGLGDSREDLNFQVPKMEEIVTVEGVLLFSDGKPVANEDVEFYSEADKSENSIDSRAKSDSQGRFTVRILKGMKGRLFGSTYTYLGEYENCPKLEELIKATGKTNLTAKTPPIEVSGEENVYNVELKFPFPFCKKSDD